MSENSGASFSEAIYKKMSDEELQNTLRCEMLSVGAPDHTQIEMILAEMERRGINEPIRSPEEAWAEFEEAYSGKESCYDDCAPAVSPHIEKLPSAPTRRRHHLKRKTLVLAAVISAILASLLTVQAAGVDVFGAIARWTTELFSFGKTEESRGLVVDGKWPEIDLERNQQFTSLQEALDYYGVTEVVAPQWIPDEFDQESVSVEQNGIWLAFFAEYADENGKMLVISYSSYVSEPPTYYEKSGSLLEIFEISGNTYYAFKNLNNYIIAWVTPHFECCISAPLNSTDMDSLKNVIVSMQ